MNLKEIRKSKGISQEQAATDLGLSLRAYQNYEYGQREPNISMIIKIADYYGVTTDYLLGHEPEQNLLKKLGLKELTDEEMFEAVENFPESVRALIIAIVHELAENHRREERSPKKRHQATIGELQEAQAQEEQAKKDAV